jgi:hypothetical protein
MWVRAPAGVAAEETAGRMHGFLSQLNSDASGFQLTTKLRLELCEHYNEPII